MPTLFKTMLHGTILNDDFQRNMGARTIFFAIFALRVFESASKICNEKPRILFKSFRIT